MMLRRALVSALAVGVFAALSVTSRAATLTQITSGGFSGGQVFWGVPLTTPAGGPYDHITFSFFGTGQVLSPLANGTLFLLSKPYNAAQNNADTPSNLSSSTDGYIAQAAASGGIYTFNTSLTLQGNTAYYFYSNGLVDAAVATSAASDSSIDLFEPFTTVANHTPNYRLSGTPVAAVVPLPSALSLGIAFLPVLLLTLTIHRRKMRKAI
jgi:hypothetical protein